MSRKKVTTIFVAAFSLFMLQSNLSYAKPEKKPRIEVKKLEVPEVVIKGKDVTLISDTKKLFAPTAQISTLKQEPQFSLEDEVKESTRGGEKVVPCESDPGCMHSNACFSLFSKVVKGDEGYYKNAVAAYLREEYNTAYDLFSELVKKFPDGKYAADAYYWIAEMNYNQYKRPNEAKKFYQVVVDKYKSSKFIDYSYYSLAFIHFGEEDFKTARVNADKVFEVKPASKVAEKSLMISILSSYFLADYEVCLEMSDKALKLFPETKHAGLLTYLKGNIYYTLEQYDKAKAEFKRYLDNYKKSGYTVYNLYGLGLSNIKLGLVAESIAPNEEILDKHPDFKFKDTVMYSLVKAYSLEGNLKKADTVFNMFLGEFPDSQLIENARYELAYRYFVKDQYEQSRERFSQFVEAYPSSTLNTAAYFMLAGADFSLGRYVDAVKEYNLFMRGSEDDELIQEAMLNLAYAYYLDDLKAEAVTAFEKIVSKYGPAFPKINEVWYFLGESYYNVGNINKAKDAFMKVEAGTEYFDLAVLGLGWIQFDLKKFTSAIELFTQYIEAGTEEFLPETYLVMSEAYFNLKDYDNALINLKLITDKFLATRVMSKTEYLIGLIKFKRGEYETSAALLKSSLDGGMDSDYADDALYWLGWSHFQLGDYEKAAAEFTNLINEFPESEHAPKAILRIGDCYYNLKRFTSAMLSYKSIIEKSPGSDAAALAEYGIIQTFYSQNDYDEIAKRSKAFVKTYPKHALGSTILLQLAEHYDEVGDYNNAAAIYSETAKLFPKSDLADDALYKSGRIMYAAGKVEEALSNFHAVTTMYPKSNLINENNYNLADAYFALKKYKDAIKYYDITTANMPKTDIAKESFRKASEAYVRSGDLINAAEELIRSVEMFNEEPYNKKTYIKIGDLYNKNMNFEKALEFYEKALDSNFKGVGVSAQMKIADTHYRLKDFETALLEYLKIIYLHKSEKDYVDDAYLRIGELYARMGENEKAKKIYIRLQNESLDPDKIGIAIERLNGLNSTGE